MVQQSKKGSGMKRIVVYFSLEGNTEYIADELAKALPADKFEFVNAVPIRIPLRYMLMSRWRAIVCSQCEQACEQAPACSIAPSGTACRNAQIRICLDYLTVSYIARRMIIELAVKYITHLL